MIISFNIEIIRSNEPINNNFLIINLLNIFPERALKFSGLKNYYRLTAMLLGVGRDVFSTYGFLAFLKYS